MTIVVHQILHNQGIEYANEFAHVFAHIVACAHVILPSKYEFSLELSFILMQVLSSGGRQEAEEIWASDWFRSELYRV